MMLLPLSRENVSSFKAYHYDRVRAFVWNYWAVQFCPLGILCILRYSIVQRPGGCLCCILGLT